MVRLSIPPVLPIVALIGGSVWLVSGVLGLSRRLPVLAERLNAQPGDRIAVTPLSSPAGLLFTVLGCAAALAVLGLALRWLTFRVEVSADGFAARLWPGRERVVPLEALKGVALVQAGGTPQLRLVRHDGGPVVPPGWALRARHDDGEVEPAGPALERLGAELGFKMKHTTLLGPVEGGPKP